MRPAFAALAAVFALAATPVLAINKCVGKDGKVTYQEAKCPDSAKASALKGPPLSSPGTVSTHEDDKEFAQIETIAGAVSAMERCSVVSPAYARNAAKVMEDYRREHAQSFARFEHSKQYQEIVRDNRAHTAEIMKDPAVRQAIANACGTLRPRPPAASGKKGGGTASGLPADVDHVIDVEAAFNVCAYGIPGWFKEMREPYEAWARRNFALLSRIHGDYHYEKEYQSRSARRSIAEPGLCLNVAEIIRGK